MSSKKVVYLSSPPRFVSSGQKPAANFECHFDVNFCVNDNSGKKQLYSEHVQMKLNQKVSRNMLCGITNTEFHSIQKQSLTKSPHIARPGIIGSTFLD